MSKQPVSNDTGFDTGTHEAFYRYYEEASEGQGAHERFAAIYAMLERMVGWPESGLNVADIGCGAGTQCRLWARRGHRVFGADINAALVALARKRCAEEGLAVSFEVASATALPWRDASMDICIAPELLEHVEDWRGCIAEFVRILKPGGALYLCTSNLLCPRQQEFTLPLYSWYPPPLKRYCVRLARSTHPQIAGHATYPAVHWFTFYGLREHLGGLGMRSFDRFDMMDMAGRGRATRLAVRSLRAVPPLRWLGHAVTPYTSVLAVKEGAPGHAA